MDRIETEYMPLSELLARVNPDNPKDHDLGGIGQSIARFGFNIPVLMDERTGMLVSGHGRLETLVGMKARGQRPPFRVVEDDIGEWLVPVVRGVGFHSDSERDAFTIADNRLTELGGWNEPALAEMLQMLANTDSSLLNVTGFDADDLDALLEQLSHPALTKDVEAGDEAAQPASKGELLALADITINEPRHAVKRGEVWQVGSHWLICADVLRDWPQWTPYLKGTAVFAPYPGAFAAAVNEAVTLVMVQPDPYIAGHILDRYAEANGEDSIGLHK